MYAFLVDACSIWWYLTIPPSPESQSALLTLSLTNKQKRWQNMKKDNKKISPSKMYQYKSNSLNGTKTTAGNKFLLILINPSVNITQRMHKSLLRKPGSMFFRKASHTFRFLEKRTIIIDRYTSLAMKHPQAELYKGGFNDLKKKHKLLVRDRAKL